MSQKSSLPQVIQFVSEALMPDKIGRGLDFYQKPSSWFEVGTYDQSLRKCLETKVDIFKLPAEQE